MTSDQVKRSSALENGSVKLDELAATFDAIANSDAVKGMVAVTLAAAKALEEARPKVEMAIEAFEKSEAFESMQRISSMALVAADSMQSYLNKPDVRGAVQQAAVSIKAFNEMTMYYNNPANLFPKLH